MKYLYLHLSNNASGGFIATLGYYALGIAICVGLAQFMPVADICNPGVPMLGGILLLITGIVLALVSLFIVLVHRQNQFARGSLIAHVVVLGGLGFLIIWVTHRL